MKNFIKAVFFLSALSITTFIGVKNVYAGGAEVTPTPISSVCVPVYGGGVQCPQTGQVLINKTVQNPSSGIFVDNLGLNDPKYRPEWIVTFQVTVQNSGDQSLDTISVTDKLPQFVDFASGPGSFDSNTKTLTFTVNNLAGGTSQTFEIKGRIVHPLLLPDGKSIICPVNVIDATTGSQTDHDESQFCIEKQMVVPAVPKAGPESWILLSLGASMLSGLYLRKKALS
jgi:uncharacterized repeat protein (TIGR01451 family)